MKILATTALLLAASFSVTATAAEPDDATIATSGTLVAYDQPLRPDYDEYWDWYIMEIQLGLNG